MGVSDRDVPAPTEIPAAFQPVVHVAIGDTPSPENDMPINPPESALPPPSAPSPAAVAEEKPKAKRGRKAKEETPAASPDPAVTCSDEKAQAAADAGVKACEPTAKPNEGGSTFGTLYVDCIPIGRAAKTLASYIEKAQEGVAKESGVADYRLVDYGKGAPLLVKYVLEQIDGSTDLMLDTRSPEGAVLLEPLIARAAFVVRGLR